MPGNNSTNHSSRHLAWIPNSNPARLESQAFAADAATICQDLAAILGGHACAETDAALARKSVWLECAFHCYYFLIWVVAPFLTSHIILIIRFTGKPAMACSVYMQSGLSVYMRLRKIES